MNKSLLLTAGVMAPALLAAVLFPPQVPPADLRDAPNSGAYSSLSSKSGSGAGAPAANGPAEVAADGKAAKPYVGYYGLAKDGWNMWDGLLIMREFLNVDTTDTSRWQHNVCVIPPLADWMYDTAQNKFPAPKEKYATEYHGTYSAKQVQEAYLRTVSQVVYESKLCPDQLQDLWLQKCLQYGRKFHIREPQRFMSKEPAVMDSGIVILKTFNDFLLKGGDEQITVKAIGVAGLFPQSCAAKHFAPSLEKFLTGRGTPSIWVSSLKNLTKMRPDVDTARLASNFMDHQDPAVQIAAFDAIGAVVRKGNGPALEDLAKEIKEIGGSDQTDPAVKTAALQAFKSYPKAIRCKYTICQEQPAAE